MYNKSNENWMPIQEGIGLFCSHLETNEQVRKIDRRKVGNKGEVVPELEEGVSVKSLSNKLKRKARNYAVISPLIDYAKEVNSPNLPQYWSVLKCGNSFTQTKNKYLKQDFYCGNRLCYNCSNVRSQKVSDLVLSNIDMSKEWCMLTLTNSNNSINFDIDNLKKRLSVENVWFDKVKDKWRKRGGDYSAIISLEIVPPGYKKKDNNGGTYYADYHPHYHILTTKKFAEYLRQEWLKSFDTADEKNQPINLVSDKAEKESLSYTIALRFLISEVVKYSIKPCLPKLKEGYNCFNVEGVDAIVTIMKGRRRLKMWDGFHNMRKSVNDIEKKEISELDLTKVVYNDLPVKDTGDIVDTYDWRGKPLPPAPEFVRDVVWNYDYKRHNYYFVDDWGDEHCLYSDYKKENIKLMICKGKEILKFQIT
jgi:Replication protein